MNAFQKFLENKPFGFIKDTDLPELIKLNRLCQVLVRLTRGGRFTCAAQDAAGLIAMVEQCGDFVRDVSVTSGEIEHAAVWQPEIPPSLPRHARERLQSAVTKLRESKPPRRPDFDESDCSGVFDGFGVTSDADPGL